MADGRWARGPLKSERICLVPNRRFEHHFFTLICFHQTWYQGLTAGGGGGTASLRKERPLPASIFGGGATLAPPLAMSSSPQASMVIWPRRKEGGETRYRASNQANHGQSSEGPLVTE